MADCSTLNCNTCAYRSNNLIFLLVNPDLLSCNRPNRDIDPVTGRPAQLFCSIERSSYCSPGCGHNGRFHSSVFPGKRVDLAQVSA